MVNCFRYLNRRAQEYVVKASYPNALVGRLDMGPFSYAENEPGCCGGLAVLAVQVGVVGLEGLRRSMMDMMASGSCQPLLLRVARPRIKPW